MFIGLEKSESAVVTSQCLLGNYSLIFRHPLEKKYFKYFSTLIGTFYVIQPQKTDYILLIKLDFMGHYDVTRVTVIWAITVAHKNHVPSRHMYRPDVCTVRAYVPSRLMYHPDVCRVSDCNRLTRQIVQVGCTGSPLLSLDCRVNGRSYNSD